jgi:CubicO group peptidase (beta-lactamase class C family)
MAPNNQAELQAAVSGAMSELEIPGVALGVVEGGRSWTWAGGVTSLEHPLAVTEDTIFQVGSISKTFVATSAAVLMDQGRLDLDVPVRSYVPELRLSNDELTGSITMRHLLTHTSGWVGDYFGNTGEGDDALAAFVTKLAKAPQITPPGWAYSYNNTAFNLAAHVVARVSGRSYEQTVKELVLRPLDMRQTFYVTDDAITRRVAIGHRDGQVQPWRRSRAYNGAGGVLSCVTDLLRYASFHLGDGHPLMSRQTMEEMQRTQRPAGSLCDEVGLAWMIDEIAGHRVLHHGGTTNGYMADLRIVGDIDLAWVLLTNSHHEHQLDRVVIASLLGPPEFASDYRPPDLTEFEGTYAAVLAELEVRSEGEGLVASVSTPQRALWNQQEEPPPPKQTRLAFRDHDRVVALDMPYTGHRAEFVRDSDGRVAWFRWDGRLAARTT